MQSRNYHYLKGFSAAELRKLKLKYNKTLPELEAILVANKRTYRWYRTKYTSYLSSNFPYLPFGFNTNKEGIASGIKVIDPNATAPEYLDFISYYITGANFLFNTTMFSPHKEAVKATLEDVLNPLSKRIRSFYVKKKSYKAAVASTLEELFHQTTLQICNLTRSVATINDVFDKQFAAFGPVPQVSLAIFFMGMSIGWYTRTTNYSYRRGVKFWKNERNDPSSIDLFREGYYAYIFQLIFQGLLASTGITLFTTIDYLTKSANEKFGWWFPNYITLPLAAWHLLCTLYPATYKFYMRDYIELQSLMNKTFDPIHTNLIQEQTAILKQINLDEKELEKQREHFATELRRTRNRNYLEALCTKATKKKSYGFWIREQPLDMIALLLLAGIGFYFGYNSIATWLEESILEPIASKVIGSVLGMLGLSILPACAERRRVILSLALEEAQREIQPEAKKSCAEKLATAGAEICNQSSGAWQTLATIGTGQRLFGDNSLLMSLTAFLASQQGSNRTRFYGPMIRETWQSTFSSKVSRQGIFAKIEAEEKAEQLARNQESKVDEPLYVVIHR